MMTIPEQLRYSALHDASPWDDVGFSAFCAAKQLCGPLEQMARLSLSDLRAWFWICAHVIEDGGDEYAIVPPMAPNVNPTNHIDTAQGSVRGT